MRAQRDDCRFDLPLSRELRGRGAHDRGRIVVRREGVKRGVQAHRLEVEEFDSFDLGNARFDVAGKPKVDHEPARRRGKVVRP